MTENVVVNTENNTVIVNPVVTENTVNVAENTSNVFVVKLPETQVSVEETPTHNIEINPVGVPAGYYLTVADFQAQATPIAVAVYRHIAEFISWTNSTDLTYNVTDHEGNPAAVPTFKGMFNQVVGTAIYSWPFVFADDAQGTNLSSNPDGKSFIGFASGKTSPTPSLNPVDYVWVHLGGGSGSLSLETEARIINNGDNTYQIVSTYSDITIYDTNKGSIPTIDIVDNILTVNNGAGKVCSFTSNSDVISFLKYIDFYSGATGDLHVAVYQNANDTPETPSGGSFNGSIVTAPAGWENSPTFVSDANTWRSEAIYTETTPGVWTLQGYSFPEVCTQIGEVVTPPNLLPIVLFPTAEHILQLKWTGSTTTYQIRLVNDIGESVYDAVHRGKHLLISDIGLGNYTAYVRSIDEFGFSPWDTSTFTVAIPEISTLSIVVSNESVTVYPNPVQRRFNLSLVITSQNVATPPTEYIESKSHTFTDLNPNTGYRVWAAINCILGSSTFKYFDVQTTNDDTKLKTILDQVLQGIDDAINTQKERIDGVHQSIAAFQDDLESLLDVITDTSSIVSEVSERLDKYTVQANSAIKQVIFDRKESDIALLDAFSRNVAWQEEYRRRLMNNERLIDTLVWEDPENGIIVNRAFAYTEESFTQAQLLIDGVQGNVNILAERQTEDSNSITDLRAEIDLLPGVITQIATAITSDAVTALQPVYSFNFFDSTQNWYAVNGTITAGLSKVLLTWGDIRNDSISYDADDNPSIRIDYERTAGSGWTGDLEFIADGTTHTLTGFIEEPVSSKTLILLNLAGIEEYTGTITSLRIILGSSTSDHFTITAITIGKSDASVQQIEDLTARVTIAEQSIDAINGEIAQRVTSTYYNANTITYSNVESVLDGIESYALVKAAYQELDANNTVTKANSAATFINGQTGTIQQLTQSFTDSIASNEQSISDVQQELSSQDGRILNQIAQLKSNKRSDYETQLELLDNLIDGKYQDLTRLEDNLRFGLAISELNVQINDTSVLAQDITELRSLIASSNTYITGIARQVLVLEQDIQGNQFAAEQLELSIENLNTGVNAAVERIVAVETDTSGLLQSVASITSTIENPTTGLSAAYGLAQVAKQTADGLVTSVSDITGQIEDSNTGLAATYQLVLEAQQNIEGLTTSVTSITNKINDPSTGLDAVASFANGGQQYAEGVSSSLSSLSGEVNHSTTGLSATYQLAGQAKSSADGTYQALVLLQNQVNDPSTGLNAVATLAQSAKTTSDTAVESITVLENKVNDSVTGLAAVASISQSAKTAADENSDSITLIENVINDPTTGLNATTTLLQTVEQTANNNTQAISSLSSRIDTAEGVGQSNLVLATKLDNELATIRSIAQLGVDVNGRAAFVRIDGETTNSKITFKADELEWLNTNNNVALGWNATQNKITIDAILQVGATVAGSSTPISSRLGSLESTSSSLGSVAFKDKIAVADLNSTVISNGKILTTLLDVDTILGTNAVFKGNLASTATLNGTTVSNLISNITANSNNLTNLSNSLGAAAYQDKIETALLGTTIFSGGYFKTNLIDVDTILGNTATFLGTVQGGRFLTSSNTSNIRVDIHDDGTYLIWVGSGSKTDSNAVFFIKKDGTGFIKGTFFQGQIFESKLVQSTDTVLQQVSAITHNSVSNPVEINVTVQSTWYDDLGEGETQVVLRRDGTIIKTWVPEYTTSYVSQLGKYVNRVKTQIFTYIDTGSTSGDNEYTITFITTNSVNVDIQEKETIFKTYENKLN